MLGEISLVGSGLWGLPTLRAAAMMARRTVLIGSSQETTETIPASQACAMAANALSSSVCSSGIGCAPFVYGGGESRSGPFGYGGPVVRRKTG